MISIAKIVLLILLLNIVALTILVIYSSNRTTSTSTSTTSLDDSTKLFLNTKAISTKKSYRFEDPLLAWKILKELDPYLILPAQFSQSINTGKAHLGMKRDENYCDKSRAYFVDHAETIFLQKNFLSDYPPSSLTRKLVIKKLGRDAQPNISYALPRNIANETVFDILPDVNSIFINAGMHGNYYLSKHFACSPHQLYNHILGITSLNSKAKVSENYQVYVDKYRGNKSYCVPEFMPESYMLKNKTQCLAFFKYIKSPKYAIEKEKLNIVFMKKLGYGSHRGEGVFPFDAEEETLLRKDYHEGQDCGTNFTNIQMQRYVANPLLIDGHKFDFRIYMLIASTNPLILYYHDGFLRVSLYKYDPYSKEKAVHLTNTDISKKIFKEVQNGTWNGMNETELRNFQMWNFTKLQNYLIANGKVNDTWLDTDLKPQIQRSMAHIGRLTQSSYLQRSNTYELFGIDFILDDDLKLWFIECNSGPVLDGTSEEKEKFLVKMLGDHFEIVFGYLRSRIKRIIFFINQIARELPEEVIYYDGVKLPEYEIKKKEYDRLNKNYVEPEFEPLLTNGFVKIIDDNLKDKNRYAGYIEEECF